MPYLNEHLLPVSDETAKDADSLKATPDGDTDIPIALIARHFARLEDQNAEFIAQGQKIIEFLEIIVKKL